MLKQPAAGEIDHWLRGVERLIALPGLPHVLLGADATQARAEAGRVEVDGMDARENFATLLGEPRPDGIERGVAHDARSERLAVEPLHDEAVAEAVVRRQHPEDFRLGHAGRP